ncbi:MAG: hypothetical protein R2881_03145 [Eubacteriales bacterium]
MTEHTAQMVSEALRHDLPGVLPDERINTAFGAIRDGGSVDAALDSGYASASGFPARLTRSWSGAARRQPANVLIYELVEARPLRPMVAVASETGLNLLEFGDRRMLESEFTDLQKRLDAVLLPGSNAFTKAAIQQISEYFAGTRTTFDVPLHAYRARTFSSASGPAA